MDKITIVKKTKHSKQDDGFFPEAQMKTDLTIPIKPKSTQKKVKLNLKINNGKYGHLLSKE